MSSIKYEPKIIEGIRNNRYVHDFLKSKFVSIEGRIAAFKVIKTPRGKDSLMTGEEWDDVNGSGLAVGFLYQDVRNKENEFLYFSCRTRKNDLTGECSDLAMILDASKTMGHQVRMEGEIQTDDPPRIYLHHIYLTDGFKYTTHNPPRDDR